MKYHCQFIQKGKGFVNLSKLSKQISKSTNNNNLVARLRKKHQTLKHM